MPDNSGSMNVYKFTMGDKDRVDADVLVYAVSFDKAMERFLKRYPETDLHAVNFICRPKEIMP